MTKFSRVIAVLALALILTPTAFASSKNTALKIKDANMEVRFNRLRGDVKVCNQENEDIRFTLEAKNTSISNLYKRNLSISANKCRTYKLRFDDDFALMANAGDKIEFVAKNVGSFSARAKRTDRRKNNFKLSNTFKKTVEEGDREVKGCEDHVGKDKIYELCVGSFIEHEPTGLRIRLQSQDQRKVVLMVTDIKWGGVEKVVVINDRNKKFISKKPRGGRLEIHNLGGLSRQKSVLLDLNTL